MKTKVTRHFRRTKKGRVLIRRHSRSVRKRMPVGQCRECHKYKDIARIGYCDDCLTNIEKELFHLKNKNSMGERK